MRPNPSSLLVLLVPLVLGLAGCGADSTELRLKVDHYKIPCTGVGDQLCLRVQEGSSDEWTLFYDGIDGFTYRWGTVYELRVLRERVEHPLADGSSFDYTLLEVLDETRVPEGTRFRMRLPAQLLETSALEWHYLILQEKGFRCRTPALCVELEARRRRGQTVEVEFSHPPGPENPLVAEALF